MASICFSCIALLLVPATIQRGSLRRWRISLPVCLLVWLRSFAPLFHLRCAGLDGLLWALLSLSSHYGMPRAMERFSDIWVGTASWLSMPSPMLKQAFTLNWPSNAFALKCMGIRAKTGWQRQGIQTQEHASKLWVWWRGPIKTLDIVGDSSGKEKKMVESNRSSRGLF